MALTRRTRKRLLFVATILAGAGLAAAGYHLVIVPRREYRARVAYEQAREAYEAENYHGVLETVGVYLGRNRHDGEALFITADAHHHVALECAARGDGEGWIKNYRGARDYAMAARAELGNDPRVLELLLVLHSTFRKIAEVEEIASLLGDESELGMKAYVHAAIWAADSGVALERARRYAQKFPESFDAQSLYLTCMADAGESTHAVLREAMDISERHPERSDFAVLLARIATSAAHFERAGWTEAPTDSAEEAGEAAAPVAPGQVAVAAVERAYVANPRERGTFSEYLVQVDAVLRLPSLTDAATQERLLKQRDQLIDRLLGDPESRQWAAATVAAWAWAATGRTADAAVYIERVAEVPDQGADEALLGWRGACAQTAQRREQIVSELDKRSTAYARLWRNTIMAIHARQEGDGDAYQRHIGDARAIAETSASWLVFLEMEVARSLSRNNDRAGAIRHLREIVDRAPTLAAPRIALYHHLLDDGQVNEALAEASFIRWLRQDDPETMYYWAVAAIAAAEAGDDINTEHILAWLERYAGLDQPEDERRRGWQDLVSLIARCHLVRGERDQARTIVTTLGETGLEVEPGLLAALLRACKLNGLVKEAATLAEKNSSSATPQLLLDRAELIAQTEGPEAAKAHLLEAIENNAGDERLYARLACVSYLDRRNDDATLEAISELLAENPDSVLAVTEALRTTTIWTDRELVNTALAGLKTFGEDEPVYHIFSALRFLTFEYSPAEAADHVQHMNDILERDPENVQALRMMASLLLRSGRGVPSGAISYMQQAARLGSVESQFDLVDLLLQAGRPEEARRAADSLRSIRHPVPASLRRRAAIWARLGMFREAEGDLEALGPETTPRDAADRAILLIELGQAQEARQIAEELLEKGFEDTGVARQVAGVFAATGEPARGKSLLEGVVASKDTREARLALGGYLLAIGEAAEAASIYEQAAAGSEAPEDWLDLAIVYVRAAQRDRACEALARAPEGEAVLAARAICARDMKDSFAPEILLEWLVKLRQARTRPVTLELFDALGSEQTLSEFADANRSLSLTWVELASLRRENGDLAGAIQSLQNAVNFTVSDPIPAMVLTDRLIAAGRWDEAGVAVNEWRDRAGDSFKLSIYASQIADHRQQWSVVLELLEPYRDQIAAEGKAGNYAPASILATSLAAEGRANEAHELLWPLIEGGQAPPTIYASVAARVGNEMSLADLEDWVNRIESRAPAGDVYAAGAQFTLALALDSAGRAEDAERRYRLILEGGAKEFAPPAANNLAELLRRDRRNLEEAVLLARSAVDAIQLYRSSAATPSRQSDELLADFLDTLGQCLLAKEQFAEAADVFRTAFDSAPEKTNLLAGLIVAKERANEPDASELLRQGIQDVGAELERQVKQLRDEYPDKRAAAGAVP